MRCIRAPTLASAHEQVVKIVLEKGTPMTTENGEETVESEEVAIRVERPDTIPMVSPASRFSERFMEQYAHDLISGSGSVFEYDYHDRLFNWGEGLFSKDGAEVHSDQIAYIIRKIRENPSTVGLSQLHGTLSGISSSTTAPACSWSSVSLGRASSI